MKTKVYKNNPYERQFLKDFEILVEHTPEEEDEGLYTAANFKKAKEQMADTYVLDELDRKYSLNCDIEKFKKFGPGIYLLFKFLKMVIIIFGILSIVAAVNLIILLTTEESEGGNGLTLNKVVLSTTIGNMETQEYFYVVFINYGMLLFMLFSLILWNEKQSHYIIQCSRKVPLTSYFTVILQKIPEDYSQIRLKHLLERQVGEVAEIYTVRDFGDDMLNYKEINQLVEEYKEERALLRESHHEINSRKLTAIFFQLRNYYMKLKIQSLESYGYKSCFAFIQFRRVQSRQRLLEEMTPFPCFSRPQRFQYYDQELRIEECQMQPGGIIWQNLHLSRISRILRFGFQVFLILTILLLSITLIFLFSSMEISLKNCVFKSMSKEQILKLNDNFALLSYCINLSTQEFYDSDMCNDYSYEYWKLTFMTILIPFIISISKFLLIEIMKALIHFRRYPYQIRRIRSQASIIFLFYFCATGLLQLFIYLATTDWKLSFFRFFSPLIKSVVHEDFDPSNIIMHSDFTPDWYKTAASNIIMIGAISFNLSAIGMILYSFIRRKIFHYYAKKQRLQIQMKKWLKGQDMQIQYIYGAVLTVIYYTLLFGANLPLSYPFAFLSLLILYWSHKYVFIEFCSKPLTYNHCVNQFVIKLLFMGIIMHCLIVPVFFSAKDIGNEDGHQQFFQRLLNMGYYFAVIIFVLLYLFLRKPLLVIWKELKSYKKRKQKEEEDPENVKRKHYSLPTTIRKIERVELDESYSMHECASYKNILKTLYTINERERTRPTCVLSPQLTHLISSQSSELQNDNHKGFIQLFKYVYTDEKKFKARKGKKSKSPYDNDKKKLKQIFFYEITKAQMNMNTEDNLVVDKTENERNKKLKKMDSHLEQVIQEDQYYEQTHKYADSQKVDYPPSSESRLTGKK